MEVIYLELNEKVAEKIEYLKSHIKEYVTYERELAIENNTDLEHTQNYCAIRITTLMSEIRAYLLLLTDGIKIAYKQYGDLFMIADVIINKFVYATTKHTDKSVKTLEKLIKGIGE